MKLREVYMNKPVYLGQVILDISKMLMYEFWYDYLKPKHHDKIKLCYMDTDSFIIYVETDDFYKDTSNDIKKWFDTSNFSKDINRPLEKGKNKKVIGKFKDELGGLIMSHFCALKSKAYAFLIDSFTDADYEKRGITNKKAKGTKKCVIKNNITFNDYYNVLFKGNNVIKSQFNSRSRCHDVYTEKINKIALSSNDDKRVQCSDKITTYPYGYYDTSVITEDTNDNSEITEDPTANVKYIDDIVADDENIDDFEPNDVIISTNCQKEESIEYIEVIDESNSPYIEYYDDNVVYSEIIDTTSAHTEIIDDIKSVYGKNIDDDNDISVNTENNSATDDFELLIDNVYAAITRFKAGTEKTQAIIDSSKLAREKATVVINRSKIAREKAQASMSDSKLTIKKEQPVISCSKLAGKKMQATIDSFKIVIEKARATINSFKLAEGARALMKRFKLIEEEQDIKKGFKSHLEKARAIIKRFKLCTLINNTNLDRKESSDVKKTSYSRESKLADYIKNIYASIKKESYAIKNSIDTNKKHICDIKKVPDAINLTRKFILDIKSKISNNNKKSYAISNIRKHIELITKKINASANKWLKANKRLNAFNNWEHANRRKIKKNIGIIKKARKSLFNAKKAYNHTNDLCKIINKTHINNKICVNGKKLQSAIVKSNKICANSKKPQADIVKINKISVNHEIITML